MVVHQYIIPRIERAGPLFQYRMHASWYRCGSSLRADAQWCSLMCYCWHCRYVSLFTNCETFNSSLHSLLWETVRETNESSNSSLRWLGETVCESNEGFNSSVHLSMRVCFECVILAFSSCAWVPEVERLGSQTRLSPELAFIFNLEFSRMETGL